MLNRILHIRDCPEIAVRIFTFDFMMQYLVAEPIPIIAPIAYSTP